MIVLLFLIPLSILLATGFLAAFIWAIRSGQFEDTHTPSMRVLLDDTVSPTAPISSSSPPLGEEGRGEEADCSRSAAAAPTFTKTIQ